ncbi:MAG: aspartate-semialdehyde dehydrogenase [Gammaproteobacteria bacterium]|nr:MAG: aspartate-semialdehyde dehydrogenase [Gammaproteobacteria bacterium]TLY87099.1 MAG: aspartate-semialdehyde dehydrogenase [Gammaproteobacteria bacterium]
MDRQFRVAVIGATGLIGETLITVLEERGFPVSQLYALASNRSLGRSASFRGRSYPVQELADFDFTHCDLALFCAGAQVSREYAPRAVAAGCLVIDNTCEFRYREDVPLVVPEVNLHALAGFGQRGIVANPDCCTIQLALVLKPLHDAAGIERIDVATYQSVSGAGRAAVEELARQSIAALSGQGTVAADAAIGRIAFNCVPHIDAFQDNGYTRAEMRLVWETRKVLGDAALRVNATAVRVPVFYGHCEAVHIQTRRALSATQARELLRKAPGVTVMDERVAGGYPTAATEAAKRDTVYVGRIREYLAPDRGLNLWIVADNVRKGAATNSVQIAEAWAQRPI